MISDTYTNQLVLLFHIRFHIYMCIILFKNIVGTKIEKKDLAVLGNLACVLDKDYIESSDPDILENLKNCKDLSNEQMGAMETVLLKGTSKYG